MIAHKSTAAEREIQERNHRLATAPFPVAHYIPGKSWAGALISNLDDAFGIRQFDRGYTEGDEYATMFLRACWEVE